jgi:hypothetical protein
MLIGAVVISPPYGYYQFLRWAVRGVAVFIAVKGYQWRVPWAIWCFAAIAVLFNPIAPIHLSREVWLPIDLVVAVAFVVSIPLVRSDAVS